VALQRKDGGVLSPAFYRGGEVGEWVRHDNSLITAALNALWVATSSTMGCPRKTGPERPPDRRFNGLPTGD